MRIERADEFTPAPRDPVPIATPGLDAPELRWIDPASIPPRRFMMGRALIRGQVSALIAPAGIGKTALTATEVLALVTGRRLLHDEVFGGPYRVRLWNLEEPREEMVRRLEAVRLKFGLGEPTGLFLSVGFEQPLVIGEMARDGVIIDRMRSVGLISSLRRQGIDVLIVDPFVSSHRVPENDNGAIDAVVKEWARIAHKADCAIVLVHHTGKLHGAEATADSARGASALIGAVRIARVLNRMSPEVAEGYGITDAWRYLRIDDGKSNYAPPADKARWCALQSVPLGNGDEVGVVVRWELPDAMAGVTVDHLDEVLSRAACGTYREAVQSPDWIGQMIAEVLGADLDDPRDKTRVKSSLKAWLKSGALKVVERRDERKREMKKFIIPGSEALQ